MVRQNTCQCLRGVPQCSDVRRAATDRPKQCGSPPSTGLVRFAVLRKVPSGRVAGELLFCHISLGFPFLLRFCDEQSGRSFYPFPCYHGPLARSWRRPFHRCGVPYPQAPTLDRDSLTATIAEFMPRRTASSPARTSGNFLAGHLTNAYPVCFVQGRSSRFCGSLPAPKVS